MIKVVAKNLVKADKIDSFIGKAQKLIKETRQNDAGCIRYELVQGLENPQLLTFLEEWEDKEALDRHMEAKHFKEIVPQFEDDLEKPGEIALYRELA